MSGQQSTEGQYHEQLRELAPYEFEQFVAELWSLQGWETEVSQQSTDQGIDVIATKEHPVHQKHVLQVKRYGEGNKVGSQAVQQYSSLRQQEPGTDTVVIVTTSEFTRQARELADQLNVKLINGHDLSNLVSQLDAHSLITNYVGGREGDSVQTPSTTTSRNNTDTESDEDEMPLDEAIIAVLQLLLIIGVFGYAAFILITNIVI
ncbi:restriction endonuclease [Halorussus sp. AFM4]|uniref:restriction endonuclease n=1 Tax=Halorussus sp. AFM4 TaxID=3421651 RepID=UPI003EC02839